VLIILASQSPRRRELLQQLGVPFLVVPSDFIEINDPRQSPAQLVQEQSLGKARDVAQRYPNRLVLGADTIVVCAGQVLPKPADAAEARSMLACLQGGWHELHTGLAFVEGDYIRLHHEVTKVRLSPLTPEDIADYVATLEPMDKAGGYGIQGIGAAFVEEIHGSYANVVGLPLPVVYQELRARGWHFTLSQTRGR